MRRISQLSANRASNIEVVLAIVAQPTKMSDTLRIERPLFCRRQRNSRARTKVEPTGDTTVIKTRFSDSEEIPEILSLSITVEMPADKDQTGE